MLTTGQTCCSCNEPMTYDDEAEYYFDFGRMYTLIHLFEGFPAETCRDCINKEVDKRWNALWQAVYREAKRDMLEHKYDMSRAEKQLRGIKQKIAADERRSTR